MSRVLGVIVVFLTALAANGQGPAADWRTVSTAHFRVHYPAEYEAWSLRAASRLESIREAVTRETGNAPPTVTDVVIMNPVASPNGLAWPLLDAPRITLFTEAPGPDEQIGSYNNWIDLLTVHEVTHIIHMLRPSRNRLQHFVERALLPFGPITLASPRWVLEGYATVIEGRLTGAGRPASTMRAVVLREWAATGRLPTYAQLDSDSRFLGMSMAYLAGSAYLEWLEQRAGPDSLRRVWARLSARHDRGFDESFVGVFGDTPERLYGQFSAELTASAVAVNRTGELREGALWQETPRGSGDPAVSPDGSLIAVVVRKQNRPANLVVWSTGPAEAEERRYNARLERILARDPEDVAAVRSKPLPRKPQRSLTLRDGGDIDGPRWAPDGHSILFSHRQPDSDGFLHYDLFRWTMQTGDITRITTRADVRDADPLPDGRTAIAVRSRFGFSQLVRVDLVSGAILPLTEPSLERAEAHPRVSPDGAHIVYVSHRDGAWRLVRRSLASGAEEELGPRDVTFASPEWSRKGPDILAIASAAGFAELHRVSGNTTVPLTRSSSAAFSPAPAPDGRVFFMNLDPDGFNVHVVDGSSQALPAPRFDSSLVPAVPPAPPAPTVFAAQQLPAPRRYGFGRQELAVLTGQAFGPSQSAVEVGVRAGDVLGRLDTFALASIGADDAQDGFAIASAWRGWPVAVSAHLFRSEDARRERNGLELRGSWTRRAPRSTFSIDAGALTGKPLDIGFVDAALATRRVAGSWRSDAELRVAAESGSTSHYRIAAGGSVLTGSLRLALHVQRDEITDGDEPLEVGGLPSSIVPRSAFATRVLDPALPVGTLVSDSYNGARAELALAGLPVSAFFQRHEIPGMHLSLAGLLVSMRAQPNPTLRLPAFTITAGVARILHAPRGDDTNWWFGLQWLP